LFETRRRDDVPAEHAEYEVEYEERADDDETDEVDPRPAVAVHVIDLSHTTPPSSPVVKVVMCSRGGAQPLRSRRTKISTFQAHSIFSVSIQK